MLRVPQARHPEGRASTTGAGDGRQPNLRYNRNPMEQSAREDPSAEGFNNAWLVSMGSASVIGSGLTSYLSRPSATSIGDLFLVVGGVCFLCAIYRAPLQRSQPFLLHRIELTAIWAAMVVVILLVFRAIIIPEPPALSGVRAQPQPAGNARGGGTTDEATTKVIRARWIERDLQVNVTGHSHPERGAHSRYELQMELRTTRVIHPVRLKMEFDKETKDADVRYLDGSKPSSLQTIVGVKDIEITFEGEFQPGAVLGITVTGDKELRPTKAMRWGVD